MIPMLRYGITELKDETGPKLCMEEVLDRSYGISELNGLFGTILIRRRCFLGVSVANCKDVSKNTFYGPLSMETPTKDPRSFHLRFAIAYDLGLAHA